MPTPADPADRQARSARRYRLRAASIADVPTLAYQRRAMFEALGQVRGPAADELEGAVRRYLERAMPAGAFVAWLVDDVSNEQPVSVSGGGMQLRELAPRPGYVAGEREGLILSMWTEPAHRRLGLAGRVLEAILAWSASNGVRRLALHASDAGRPLYARHGFRPTNEMRLERAPERSGAQANALT
jgi:GNAT superfamily N-acetyltransferase